MDNTFIGYSTIDPSRNRSWVLYDKDLIKRDLLNHFYTKKGERVMRPTFGCSIWEMIYEQLTPDIVEKCRLEVERIVTLDSRIEAKSINVMSSQNGIVIMVDMYYRPFDVVERLRIEFENRQS